MWGTATLDSAHGRLEVEHSGVFISTEPIGLDGVFSLDSHSLLELFGGEGLEYFEEVLVGHMMFLIVNILTD